MSPAEINKLCSWLIDYRDTLDSRADREMLADVCGALDSFAKLTRAAAVTPTRQLIEALKPLSFCDPAKPPEGVSVRDWGDAVMRARAVLLATAGAPATSSYIETAEDYALRRSLTERRNAAEDEWAAVWERMPEQPLTGHAPYTPIRIVSQSQARSDD